MSYEVKARVVGVSHSNEDGASRQALLEELYDEYYTEGLEDEIQVEVRHEPDNAHDSNACAVWVTRPLDESQVGYLPAGQAEWVSEAIQDGRLELVELESMGQAKRGGGKIGMSLLLTIRNASDGGDDLDEEGGSNVVEDADGRYYEFS